MKNRTLLIVAAVIAVISSLVYYLVGSPVGSGDIAVLAQAKQLVQGYAQIITSQTGLFSAVFVALAMFTTVLMAAYIVRAVSSRRGNKHLQTEINHWRQELENQQTINIQMDRLLEETQKNLSDTEQELDRLQDYGIQITRTFIGESLQGYTLVPDEPNGSAEPETVDTSAAEAEQADASETVTEVGADSEKIAE